MLHISCLPLGSYQTNCYIVWGENAKTCAVIDPGYAPERVLEEVRRLGLAVDAILLTHGHFDHVGAVEALVKTTGCALWMHEGDYSQFPGPTTAYFYPLANCDFTEVQFCEEGQVIHAGGLDFTVLSTPGHTWGSVCYRCGDGLFSGDTLFAGSCGRTDLPGGDTATLGQSLQRLRTLPDGLAIYPGHGGSSTMGEEKGFNPYL